MPIELEDDHYQSHANDPDPDCAQCRETWDYYSEAVAIVEERSLLAASRKHLEAAVERVEQREAAILQLRRLLENAASFAGDIFTRFDDIYDVDEESGTGRKTEHPYSGAGFDTQAAERLKKQITNILATTWPVKDLKA